MQNNKRVIILIISIIAILLCLTASIYAEGEGDEESIVKEQMQSNEIKGIQEQLKKYSGQDVKEILPDYDPQKILEDATKGKFEFNIQGVINRGLMYLFKELYLNIHVLIKLIILCILCAVLKNLQTSFLSESVGELAFYACYIVIISILLVSMNTVISLGRDIIDSMVGFMQASIPVLITLLASSGNITSAGVFQPILITIVEVCSTIIKNVFIPLILLSTILSIIDNISDKAQVSKLAGFIKQISGWALGLVLTIFIAIVSIQGSLGAVVDGVTSKTAKFAIGAFIPVVGKYLADAADAVIGCTLLIKNAAGIVVMIGIICVCLVPLLKILALITLYRLTCALVQPIAEKRIVNCITDVANSLTSVLGVVAAVAFMFLISITAIISASNISAMMR